MCFFKPQEKGVTKLCLRTEKIAKKSYQRLQIIKKFKVFFKCDEFYKYQVPPICCNDSLVVKSSLQSSKPISLRNAQSFLVVVAIIAKHQQQKGRFFYLICWVESFFRAFLVRYIPIVIPLFSKEIEILDTVSEIQGKAHINIVSQSHFYVVQL